MFLYGWGPFPEMGIAGIALSTVLIQAGATVYLFFITVNWMDIKDVQASVLYLKTYTQRDNFPKCSSLCKYDVYSCRHVCDKFLS